MISHDQLSAPSLLSLLQSLLQEAAADPELQHHALHLQHGDHDEGEGQHPLLLPAAPRHDALHRGLPHGEGRAQGRCVVQHTGGG